MPCRSRHWDKISTLYATLIHTYRKETIAHYKNLFLPAIVSSLSSGLVAWFQSQLTVTVQVLYTSYVVISQLWASHVIAVLVVHDGIWIQTVGGAV